MLTCFLYVATESKTPNTFTGSTHLPPSFLSTSSSSIVTPTITVTLGKWALCIKQYIIWYTSLFDVYTFYTESGSGSILGLESDLGFGKWLLINGQSIYY